MQAESEGDHHGLITVPSWKGRSLPDTRASIRCDCRRPKEPRYCVLLSILVIVEAFCRAPFFSLLLHSPRSSGNPDRRPAVACGRDEGSPAAPFVHKRVCRHFYRCYIGIAECVECGSKRAHPGTGSPG